MTVPRRRLRQTAQQTDAFDNDPRAFFRDVDAEELDTFLATCSIYTTPNYKIPSLFLALKFRAFCGLKFRDLVLKILEFFVVYFLGACDVIPAYDAIMMPL